MFAAVLADTLAMSDVIALTLVGALIFIAGATFGLLYCAWDLKRSHWDYIRRKQAP